MTDEQILVGKYLFYFFLLSGIGSALYLCSSMNRYFRGKSPHEFTTPGFFCLCISFAYVLTWLF